jgi:uncharacterized protein YuzE
MPYFKERNPRLNHDKAINVFFWRMKAEGYRVIKLIKPIPDLILIDFENKRVLGVEMEKEKQTTKETKNTIKRKTKSYKNSDFDSVVCVLFNIWNKDEIHLRELRKTDFK